MSTVSTPPEQANRSFELIETVGEAYQSVFKNIRLLPAIICLPLLLDILIKLVTEFTPVGALIANQEIAAQWPPSGEFLLKLLAVLAVAIVQIFSIVLLYVAWYRLVLLGAERAYPSYFYPVERRHIRLFGYSLLVAVIVLSFTAVAALIGVFALGVGTGFALSHLLLVPVVVYLFFVLPLRFSFLFPAVAVDEQYRLSDSWRHTRKQTLKLIGGAILCLLPATTLAGLLGVDSSMGFSVSLGADTTVTPVLSPLFAEVLSYLVGAFNSLVIASFIALAFKASTGWVPEYPDSEIELPKAL